MIISMGLAVGFDSKFCVASSYTTCIQHQLFLETVLQIQMLTATFKKTDMTIFLELLSFGFRCRLRFQRM